MTSLYDYLRLHKTLNKINFNQYAEGKDLKEHHPPRYVLISRKKFYTTGFGADENNYKILRKAMDYAVAAPNHMVLLASMTK